MHRDPFSGSFNLEVILGKRRIKLESFANKAENLIVGGLNHLRLSFKTDTFPALSDLDLNHLVFHLFCVNEGRTRFMGEAGFEPAFSDP